MADEFTRTLRALLGRSRRGSSPAASPNAPVVTPVELNTRLVTLEREMEEVRGRINGLLYLVVGAVLTQLVLRLVG